MTSAPSAPRARLSLRRRRIRQAVLGIVFGVLLGVLYARFQLNQPEGWLAERAKWVTYVLAVVAGAFFGYLLVAVPRAALAVLRKYWWQAIRVQSGDRAQLLTNLAQDRIADEEQVAMNPHQRANDLAILACLRRQYVAAVDRLSRIPNHDKGPVASNLLVALAETQRWSQVAELLSRDVRDFPEGNLARLALMAPEGQVLDSVVALVKGGQNLPRVLNNLGVRHLRAGHLDEAREPLRRAVDQRTLYVNARVNLATVAYRQGDLQEALVEMTRASESAPAEPLVCSNLGAILCETGDPIVAEQWLTRAVQRDPHNPAVLINLGNCYALQVKYEEALEAYRTAARREEATAMADYNAALVQIECGEYESAAQHLQAAHTRAPEDADILNNLGFIFWHQKDYDRADEAFRRAAELDPSGTSAGNLVCVELAAGRAGEALELLQHADYDPVEVAFDKGLAHLLAALSIDREAGATQRRLYDHHLQNALAGFGAVTNSGRGPLGEAYINLALVEYLNEHFEAAAKGFAEAAKRFPDIPQLGYYAGVSFLLGGMQKQAQRAEPGDDLTPVTLDYFRQARPYLEKALASPQVADEACYQLGVLHYLLGDFSRAIELLRKAAGPEAPPEVFNALGIALSRQAQEMHTKVALATAKGLQGRRQVAVEINKLLSSAIHYFRLVLKAQPHSPLVHANIGLAHLLRNAGDDVETALHHWNLMRQIGGAWGQRAFDLFSRAAATEDAKRLKFQDIEMTFRPVPAKNWIHYVPPRLSNRRYLLEDFPDLPPWTLHAYHPLVRRALRYRDRVERARSELHMLGA